MGRVRILKARKKNETDRIKKYCPIKSMLISFDLISVMYHLDHRCISHNLVCHIQLSAKLICIAVRSKTKPQQQRTKLASVFRHSTDATKSLQERKQHEGMSWQELIRVRCGGDSAQVWGCQVTYRTLY